MVDATANPPKSDDWKWATDKRRIHNNKRLLKKPTCMKHFRLKYALSRLKTQKSLIGCAINDKLTRSSY